MVGIHSCLALLGALVKNDDRRLCSAAAAAWRRRVMAAAAAAPRLLNALLLRRAALTRVVFGQCCCSAFCLVFVVDATFRLCCAEGNVDRRLCSAAASAWRRRVMAAAAAVPRLLKVGIHRSVRPLPRLLTRLRRTAGFPVLFPVGALVLVAAI